MGCPPLLSPLKRDMYPCFLALFALAGAAAYAGTPARRAGAPRTGAVAWALGPPLVPRLRLRGGCGGGGGGSEQGDVSEDGADEEKRRKKRAKELRRQEKGAAKEKKRREKSDREQAPDEDIVAGVRSVRYCSDCGVPEEYCAYVGCKNGRKPQSLANSTTGVAGEPAKASDFMQSSAEALGKLSVSGSGQPPRQDQGDESRHEKTPPSQAGERSSQGKKTTEKAKVRPTSVSRSNPFLACVRTAMWSQRQIFIRQ